MFNRHLWVILGALALLLTTCSSPYPETCPSSTPIGLSEAEEIASDDTLLFRFPLDADMLNDELFYGWFGVSNTCPPDMVDCYNYRELQYHAAEDYKSPPGTPVYAMTDGRISFSGEAGGYGWLILIDHPQAKLYSLYGHLSPSRWKLENGTEVKRGELIGYLGDSFENGGSVEAPVVPHLHFGIRAGQTADYPVRGEWRVMAGWIRLCPQDLGWLQPSLVITNREIPAGGYPQPKVGFLSRWGFEVLITSLYTTWGAGMLVAGIKKRMTVLMLFPGIMMTVAGIVLHSRRLLETVALLALGVVFAVIGVYKCRSKCRGAEMENVTQK